jgi:uncharacterized protein YodC (DUF2158 family)
VVSMVVEEIAEGGGHLKWADSGTGHPRPDRQRRANGRGAPRSSTQGTYHCRWMRREGRCDGHRSSWERTTPTLGRQKRATRMGHPQVVQGQKRGVG